MTVGLYLACPTPVLHVLLPFPHRGPRCWALKTLWASTARSAIRRASSKGFLSFFLSVAGPSVDFTDSPSESLASRWSSEMPAFRPTSMTSAANYLTDFPLRCLIRWNRAIKLDFDYPSSQACSSDSWNSAKEPVICVPAG
ncbi:hypothetical protein T11_6105 [Trichinella zimbabwensis]|uniref:Uncharacterized protein n=1 Tax=Trichinella zimbabwensis TaxID=268475 RepID=A0A0V1IA93_9BILA|nr:hypothetical protein T11_6105 [Trichinella zimbabwensis]